MSPYLIWVPVLIILTALWALVGKHVNTNPTSLWFYMLFFSIPVWPFVCRISKNLVFDSIVYDMTMTIVYAGTFAFLGAGANFTVVQWVGFVVAMIGLLLMKAPI